MNQPLHSKTLPDSYFRVGVIGYTSRAKFDFKQATEYLRECFPLVQTALVERFKVVKPILVVARLEDRGMSKIAYSYAKHERYKTAGIACHMLLARDRAVVDYYILDGHTWTEESDAFLANVDAVIRIGGYRPEHMEYRKARELELITEHRELAPLTAEQLEAITKAKE